MAGRSKLEITTDKVLVSYPNLFVATENKLSGKMEFYMVAVYPKGADLSKEKAAVKAAAEEKWGADQTKWPKGLQWPFKKNEDAGKKNEAGDYIVGADGKRLLPEGYEEGGYHIRVKSNKKPPVYDMDNSDLIMPEKFYAGCLAQCALKAFAYQVGNKVGVSLWIQGVKKVADGSPIGAKFRPEEHFAPIAGTQAQNAHANPQDIFSM